jgi:hypothetical protein
VTLAVSSLCRFGLSAFTLALGGYDIAQMAVGSLADQSLPLVRRGVQIAVGVVLVVFGSA